MTPKLWTDAPVLVVGAGIMGAGIAQVAAQAGHLVRLFDARTGAAQGASAVIRMGLEMAAAKGRLTGEAARAAATRIVPLETLREGMDAGLVVEAIVEDLEAKRAVFRELEPLVRPDCVLATNTSSVSITVLSTGLRAPERLVGMHFFNPAPAMKLVEVISGLHTDEAVAEAVCALAARWGKTPVRARSTPGFIVNRIARPFYAEPLALLQERAATPEVLDACARGAGFRMGPCELMDLIGHDTNLAVTESVYRATFEDRRFTPSIVQRELVDGGLLGRKSGRGFYDYRGTPRTEGAAKGVPSPAPAAATLPAARTVTVRGRGPAAERWARALEDAGAPFERFPSSPWEGLEVDGAQLRLTDGRPASRLSAEGGPADLAVFDLPIAPDPAPGAALAWARSARASAAWSESATGWLRAAGFEPVPVGDAPGLVVARTIAMLINEACDAVRQGVCTPEGADLAMKLGVGYPAGPFEWLERWGAGAVVALLDGLNRHYRGERYRASPELLQRAWAGNSTE